MYPFSLSARSIAATTIDTSGWSRWIRSIPSGAAISAINRTDVDGTDDREASWAKAVAAYNDLGLG